MLIEIFKILLLFLLYLTFYLFFKNNKSKCITCVYLSGRTAISTHLDLSILKIIPLFSELQVIMSCNFMRFWRPFCFSFFRVKNNFFSLVSYFFIISTPILSYKDWIPTSTKKCPFL